MVIIVYYLYIYTIYNSPIRILSHQAWISSQFRKIQTGRVTRGTRNTDKEQGPGRKVNKVKLERERTDCMIVLSPAEPQIWW